MSEALKERKEMDPQYQWDLTKMYASDAEWEKAFAAIDPKVEALAAWEGKLNNAASIREFYDAEIGVFRELENLAVYTSLRLSEDTRADDAQSMDARATAKYVKAVGTIAYAQPEILALPQETLDAIMADEQVAPYRFALEDLLRAKPHTLTAPEEKLLAAFGEAFGTPKNVADNLADADMVFDSVKDGEGNDVELTASNYILLQTSNDRVLRKNAFESYYKSFRQHINTLAASYSGAVKTAAAEASVRHYESSRAMSMAGENVPGQVYDNLVATVRKHLPDMYRYVALRKRILGVDELHYYDVYAPLTKGVSAKLAAEQGLCTKDVEDVIEANTLLSGLGVQNGSCAGAHSIAEGITVLEPCAKLLHGEVVAFGILVQLIVEGAPAEELDELYTFFEEVGLPTTFDDLGIPDATEADIRKVAETSMHSYWDVEPFAVNPQMVFDGIMMANTLGKRRKGL